MDGLGTGKQAGMDYKQAKKDYDKQSWADPTGERPDKPSRFQFFTGTAPQQQAAAPAASSSPAFSFGKPSTGVGSDYDLHAMIERIIEMIRSQ